MIGGSSERAGGGGTAAAGGVLGGGLRGRGGLCGARRPTSAAAGAGRGGLGGEGVLRLCGRGLAGCGDLHALPSQHLLP